MTRTNDLFLPRRPVSRDSVEFQAALAAARLRRLHLRGEEPAHPDEPLWVEAEARATIGRSLLILAEGGDGPGGCWACTCPTHDSPSGEVTWFCPAANGRICDICCYYDMNDAYDGLRAWGDGPCLGCEHYDEHAGQRRPTAVVQCTRCRGPIAAGTWAYKIYIRAHWQMPDAGIPGADPLADVPRDDDDARWEWEHVDCRFRGHDEDSGDVQDSGKHGVDDDGRDE
jgi:hypothetical protein